MYLSICIPTLVAPALVQEMNLKRKAVRYVGERKDVAQPSDRGNHYDLVAGIHHTQGVIGLLVFEGACQCAPDQIARVSPVVDRRCSRPPQDT